MLGQLVNEAGEVHTEADDLLLKLFPDASVSSYREEFAEILATLESRRTVGLVYPANYAVEEGTARLLYGIVRAGAPDHIWETGVANGVSSLIILKALERNGSGTLHSTDIASDVGALVHPEEREAWDLHVIDRTRAAGSLLEYARRLPPLDLFIHDSLHTFRWQTTELGMAAERLRPGGLMASDDVDASYAFADFCRSHELAPLLLMDRRKFFGIARWSP